MEITIHPEERSRYQYRTNPETNLVTDYRLYGWTGVDTGTLIVVRGNGVFEEYFLRSSPLRGERVIEPEQLAKQLAEFYSEYENVTFWRGNEEVTIYGR